MRLNDRGEIEFDELFSEMVSSSSPASSKCKEKSESESEKKKKKVNSCHYDNLSVEDKVWVDGLISSSSSSSPSGVMPISMPAWAGVWPGGQLAAIGRSGRYSSNIERFENHFREKFSENVRENISTSFRDSSRSSVNSDGTLLRYVTLVELSHLSDGDKLQSLLTNVARKVDDRKNKMSGYKYPEGRSFPSSSVSAHLVRYLKTISSSSSSSASSRSTDQKKKASNQPQGLLVRNAAPEVDASIEPTAFEIGEMKNYFKGEKERLSTLSGMSSDSFPWSC
jgi:hypothetical protein